MRCEVRDEQDVLLRVEEREPACGEDFCDSCGDCLRCYGGDSCCGEGFDHRWIRYEERK